MPIHDIIKLLTSMSDVSSGTNLTYRFEHNIRSSEIFSLSYNFYDSRQADFYYSVLKDIPNLELSITESQYPIKCEEVLYLEDEPDAKVKQKTVCIESRFVWHLKFKSTIDLVNRYLHAY